MDSHILIFFIRRLIYLTAPHLTYFLFVFRTSHSGFTSYSIGDLLEVPWRVSLLFVIILMLSVQNPTFPSSSFSLSFVSLTFPSLSFCSFPPLLYICSVLVILILSHNFQYFWYIAIVKIISLSQTFLFNFSCMYLIAHHLHMVTS